MELMALHKFSWLMDRHDLLSRIFFINTVLGISSLIDLCLFALPLFSHPHGQVPDLA